MVLTPQLLQAIKLLQMPNFELAAFIENELASNPLLERAEERRTHTPSRPTAAGVARRAGRARRLGVRGARDRRRGPRRQSRHRNRKRLRLGPHRAGAQIRPGRRPERRTSWTGVGAARTPAKRPDLEAYVAEPLSLARASRAAGRDRSRRSGRSHDRRALIDGLDEAGYFVGSLAEIAARLGAPLDASSACSSRLQTLEPTGVFARTLAECLALQLIERDRFDPAMQALIDNLPALAKRDLPLLRKVCGVDDEDLGDMIAEIRRLDPKPGRGFGDPPGRAGDSRRLRHRRARHRLAGRTQQRGAAARAGQRDLRRPDPARRQARRGPAILSTHLQAANWLTKSLEQRARTILNVASEIVRRQDAFLVDGVSGLRPLNLKMVGDAIGVHEFDGLARHRQQVHSDAARPVRDEVFLHRLDRLQRPGQAHSAESVRQHIRQMIDDEDPDDVLSDDVIVDRLRQADIVVARRTVAKYRDSLRFPSSVERRK